MTPRPRTPTPTLCQVSQHAVPAQPLLSTLVCGWWIVSKYIFFVIHKYNPYSSLDDYSKANFNAAESSDGAGNAEGSYSVALPDGR